MHLMRSKYMVVNWLHFVFLCLALQLILKREMVEKVVNWLHFVFLCLALQPAGAARTYGHGCELITFCIFMPGFTAMNRMKNKPNKLWIDYILYFYAWLYSSCIQKGAAGLVVNWLHFVFLCLALQLKVPDSPTLAGCELITFCIFMPGFTAFKL